MIHRLLNQEPAPRLARDSAILAIVLERTLSDPDVLEAHVSELSPGGNVITKVCECILRLC